LDEGFPMQAQHAEHELGMPITWCVPPSWLTAMASTQAHPCPHPLTPQSVQNPWAVTVLQAEAWLRGSPGARSAKKCWKEGWNEWGRARVAGLQPTCQTLGMHALPKAGPPRKACPLVTSPHEAWYWPMVLPNQGPSARQLPHALG
jgi:hypothetical protein